MELSLQEIVFYVVGAGILFCSVMAVTAGKILHSATYLLFVLLVLVSSTDFLATTISAPFS